jgi:hypothetical protein
LSQSLQGADDPAHRSRDLAALESAWPRAMDALSAVLDTAANEQPPGQREA